MAFCVCVIEIYCLLCVWVISLQEIHYSLSIRIAQAEGRKFTWMFFWILLKGEVFLTAVVLLLNVEFESSHLEFHSNKSLSFQFHLQPFQSAVLLLYHTLPFRKFFRRRRYLLWPCRNNYLILVGFRHKSWTGILYS